MAVRVEVSDKLAVRAKSAKKEIAQNAKEKPNAANVKALQARVEALEAVIAQLTAGRG